MRQLINVTEIGWTWFTDHSVYKLWSPSLRETGNAGSTVVFLKTMQQYGLKIPTFAITHLGTPEIYAAVCAEAGSNYHFVSCFTPGDIDESVGVKEMSAAADKYGYGVHKTNVNYVSGWVVGQLIAESIARLGQDATREKLVETMNKGFEVDTKGVAAPLRYTRDDHRGLVGLRPYSYDYQTKQFKTLGKYSDYDKYVN